MEVVVLEQYRGLMREVVRRDLRALSLFSLGNWPVEESSLVADLPADVLKEVYSQIGSGIVAESYITALRPLVTRSEVQPSFHWQNWALLLLSLLLVLVGGYHWLQYRKSLLVEERVGSVAEPTTPPALTPKEQEVLTAIGTGKTNKAIAAELFISEATLKTHINSIYRKLGLANRAAAVAYAKSVVFTGV